MIIRHEINLSGTFTGVTPSEVVLLDSTKYSGTCTYYFEILVNTAVNGNTVSLQRKSGGTNDASITISTTTGLYRTSFTPPSSATEYIVVPGGANTSTVKCTRIIIIQDTGTNALTASESQFEIGNKELGQTVSSTNTLYPLNAPKYWRYNAINFDGSCTFYAECTYNVSSTTGNKTIVIQESSDLFTWTTATTLLSASSGSTTATRIRGSAFTPKDRYYYRLAWSNSSSMTNLSIYNAKIIVDQTSATEITKLEEHYLLANTTLAAGTALQNFLTKWDSAEWSGVDNAYTHQIDAISASTSVIEIDTSAGSQVVGSVVNSPNVIGYSYDDSVVTTPSGSAPLSSNNTSRAAGQTFTSTAGGNIFRASFYLYKTGSPTGNMVAKLYTITGTYGTNAVPSTLLATSDGVDASTLTTSTSGQEVFFTFSSTVSLTAGNTYAIVVEYTGGNSGNCVNCLGSGSSTAHNGNPVFQNQSLVWSNGLNQDTLFTVRTRPGIILSSNGNIDVKATTNSGNIYGSRIIVSVVKAVISSSAKPFSFGYIIQ